MGIENFTSVGDLQDYVKADDATRYDTVLEGHVRLDVTHSNLEQKWHDLLFSLDMTIGDVKAKLYRHGGTSACAQELFLRRGPGDTILMHDDRLTLRHFGTCSGMGIHIKDNDPHSLSANGGLENVALVQKYEMDDETYDQMKNTVRAQKTVCPSASHKPETARRLNSWSYNYWVPLRFRRAVSEPSLPVASRGPRAASQKLSACSKLPPRP